VNDNDSILTCRRLLVVESYFMLGNKTRHESCVSDYHKFKVNKAISLEIPSLCRNAAENESRSHCSYPTDVMPLPGT